MKVPKHKKTARRGIASQIPSGRICSNCRQTLKTHEGHFFPPSMGDSGFFVCAPPESAEINKEATKGYLSNGFKLSPSLSREEKNRIYDGMWP